MEFMIGWYHHRATGWRMKGPLMDGFQTGKWRENSMTTETTEPETVTYELEDVPVVTVYRNLVGDPLGAFGWSDDEPDENDDKLRQAIFDFYTAPPMRTENAQLATIFDNSWTRGVEREELDFDAFDELYAEVLRDDEGLDEDRARWHYVFGYLVGQVASYGEWGTPYAMSDDDEFYDN